MTRRIVLFFLLCFLFPARPFAGGIPPYVPGEILVKFKDRAVEAKSLGAEERTVRRLQVLRSLDLDVERHYPRTDVYRVHLGGPMSLVESLRALKARDDVAYAEPNYTRRKLEVIPNDPLYPDQWALESMAMPGAWAVETGTGGVVLGFADSGIDIAHEDLAGNLWRNPGEVCDNGLDDDHDGYVDNCYGLDAVTGAGNPVDDDGHGTHISGLAGAVGNNGVGMSGVNWDVSIMALRFIGPNGYGDVAAFVEAVEFAAANGVRVINMSFGAYSYSETEKQAIQAAPAILFVAAAGNERYDNDVHPLYPASYDLPNILSVAASNLSDGLASFSNFGRNTVDVAAPGVDVLGPIPGDAYDAFSGTSMSTALVSGLAGLLLAANPSLTVLQVKDRILRTADVSPGLDQILTGGRVNALRALTESVSGPYIYRLIPAKGSVGSQVTLRGSGFGTVQGTVLFEGGLPAEIVSWDHETIVVKVPEGAVTGGVRVETPQGSSNTVTFEVTLHPTGIKLSFPEVRADPSDLPILVIANPLEQPVRVYVRIVETGNRDQTIKVVTLKNFEKWFLDLRAFAPAETQTLFLECESEGFFGAAVLSLSEDLSKVVPMPPIIGDQLNFIEVPPK